MTIRLYSGNHEPTIEELLDDEIATLLMSRDGLDVSDVVRVVDEAKAALFAPGSASWLDC